MGREDLAHVPLDLARIAGSSEGAEICVDLLALRIEAEAGVETGELGVVPDIVEFTA